MSVLRVPSTYVFVRPHIGWSKIPVPTFLGGWEDIQSFLDSTSKSVGSWAEAWCIGRPTPPTWTHGRRSASWYKTASRVYKQQQQQQHSDQFQPLCGAGSKLNEYKMVLLFLAVCLQQCYKMIWLRSIWEWSPGTSNMRTFINTCAYGHIRPGLWEHFWEFLHTPAQDFKTFLRRSLGHRNVAF